MATVQSIAQAIADVAATIDGVDQTSIDDYLPSIKTQSIACLVLPFGQTDTVTLSDFGPNTAAFTHRIKVEFWIKHVQGKAANTMQRAREIFRLAVIALINADGTGYTLSPDLRIEGNVEQGFLTVESMPYLVATLYVPVLNEEDL